MASTAELMQLQVVVPIVVGVAMLAYTVILLFMYGKKKATKTTKEKKAKVVDAEPTRRSSR